MSKIAEPRDTLPLSRIHAPQQVWLVEICGGHRLRKRLADLGLTLGAPLRVVQSYGGGPMIIAVKEDTRMAIGRGIAHKMLVTLDPPTRIPPHIR